MTPQFRFTMFNATVSPSGTVVNQPVGWRDAGPSLERDGRYHSLIEYFKGSFIWFGTARQFIIDVEDNEGPEGQIRLLIEIYYSVWETVFDGKIDISQLEDVTKVGTYYKMSAPIIRDDFWSRFINRTDSPVDLQSTTDMDGGTRTAVNKITLPLPSQIVQTSFERQVDWADNVLRTLDETAIIAADVSGTTAQYLIFSNANVVVDEIEERAEHGTILSAIKPTAEDKYLIKAKFAGEYVFDASIRYTVILSASRTFSVKWYRAIKSEGVIAETQIGSTQSGTDSLITDDGARVLSLTIDLLAGDEFYIYGEVVISSAVSTMSYFPDYDSDLGAPYDPVYTQLEIVAKTVFPDTTTDAYLIKDAAESVLSKIVGQDAVVASTMFAGCKRLYTITRGKHIRGESYSSKKMFLSFKEWWDVVEPCLNIGLSYDLVSSVKKIRIEPKEYFYDPVPVVFLNNVVISGRTYDNNLIYKKIDIGFADWSKESKSGIDDPQTKRVFNVNTFSTIGVTKSIVSTGYASSLGIEQLRRDQVQAGKDNPLDEKIILTAVKVDGSDFTPEVGTDFNAVTNLLNSDTRYNIRLSPSRIFNRWKKFLQGMLEHTTGAFFYFGSGEGNYKMTSQLEVTDCEATDDPEPVLDENANIAVDETNYNFIPQRFKGIVPMSWATYKTILAQRTKAIGIAQPDGTYLPYFIDKFDFIHMSGKASIEVWLANRTPLTLDNFILQEDGNMILMEDGTSGILTE